MTHHVGDVVVAGLFNALENPEASGKPRPVVLVREEGGHWLVSGLTTRSHYQDGSARTSIPEPFSMGLTGSGYLWSPRLARISKIDVHYKIGRVNRACADLIIELSSLHGTWAEDLRASSHASGTTGTVTR